MKKKKKNTAIVNQSIKVFLFLLKCIPPKLRSAPLKSFLSTHFILKYD